mmetsp:Transcript_25007/g.38472  ORF Transcript_25007/g.38472 Transcript_25007/m.38472 type:complete len:175 (-) Transcript_25007:293-817(-)
MLGMLRRRRANSICERKEDEVYQAPEEDTSTILACLIRMRLWEQVLEHIIELPEDARSPMSVTLESGMTSTRFALHEACRFKAPVEVISALVDLNPAAVKCRDSLHFFMPLHLACRHGCSAEVVHFLIESWPTSLEKRDKVDRTPCDLVRQSSQSNKGDILEILNSKNIAARSA